MIMKNNLPLRRCLSTSLALIGLLASTHVAAEIEWSGLYSGAFYSNSQLEYKPDGATSQSQDWGHAKAKLGYLVNEFVSAEGQLGMTTNSDLDKGTLTFGAYLRASKDFGQYKPYALIGLGGYYSYADGVDSTSETGLSYGIGLEVFGSKDLAISFEYLTVVNKSVDGGDLTFDTLGVGFTYYFTEDTSYFNKNRNKIRSIRY